MRWSAAWRSPQRTVPTFVTIGGLVFTGPGTSVFPSLRYRAASRLARAPRPLCLEHVPRPTRLVDPGRAHEPKERHDGFRVSYTFTADDAKSVVPFFGFMGTAWVNEPG